MTPYPLPSEMKSQSSQYLPCSVDQLEFLKHDEAPACSSRVADIINVFYLNSVNRDGTMIHIAVPDTQILVEKKDGVSKYTAFNVHINGWFHTAVRFSHLYQLSEYIKEKFGSKYRGPDFPPKKLFALDEKQLEERRLKIAKYLNALVQTPDIIRHASIEKKFLDLQMNSFRATSSFVTVDVYLGDGERIVVKATVDSPTNEVLKKLAVQLGAPDVDTFLWNFGLFMAKPRERDGSSFNMLCVRLLRNFESPYISLQTVNLKSAGQGVYHKLILRKLIWDPRVEESLFDDPFITDLIYRQAKCDRTTGAFEVLRPDVEDKLRSCERREDKIQFLRICHLQPTYLYELLSECTSDYPREGTKCGLKIGRRQIVLKHGRTTSDQQESIFRATRIRVWKISQPTEPNDPLIFQFEYLMSKDSFEWITLYTDQAIILSLLLQCIGTEILHEHRNMSIEQQLFTNGGGSGMSIFLEPKKAAARPKLSPQVSVTPINTEKQKDISPNPEASAMASRRLSDNSIHSVHSLKSAKSAITSPDDVSSLSSGPNSERGVAIDPLGVADLYGPGQDVFTTITDALPLHNDAFANITDDDL